MSQNDACKSHDNLKEKILQEIEDSIRKLLECKSKQQPFSLQASPVLTLCQYLDFAMLQGLRHLLQGYWPLVRECSQKSLIQGVETLVTVTTAIGKGRAWLCCILNEGSLASYLQAFLSCPRLLRKNYYDSSLLRDRHCTQKLLQLALGMDGLCFQLDPDCPLLDAGFFHAQPQLQVKESDNHTSGNSTRSSSIRSIASLPSPGDSGITILDLETEYAHAETQDNHINCILALSRVHSTDLIPITLGGVYDTGGSGDHVKLRSADSKSKHLTASKRVSFHVDSVDNLTSLYVNEERGVPEGQEDPVRYASSISLASVTSQHRNSKIHRHSRGQWRKHLPRVSLEELATRIEMVEKEFKEELEKEISQHNAQQNNNNILEAEQLQCLQTRLGIETEVVKQVFWGSLGHVQGLSESAIVVLTDVSIHVGIRGSKGGLKPHSHVFYSDIEAILVGPWSVWIMVIGGKTRFQLCLGSTESNESLVSHIEVNIRRSKCRQNNIILPSICSLRPFHTPLRVFPQMHSTLLYLGVAYVEEVRGSPLSTPLGPHLEGHLMWRKPSSVKQEAWEPIYVVLKGGILYHFENMNSTVPLKVYPLYGYVGGHRIKTNRPHAFELSWDQEIMQYAAADESDVSEWMQAIMHASTMTQSPTDDFGEASSCYVGVTEKELLAVREDPNGTNASIVAQTCLTAINTVIVGRNKEVWCCLETECAEVNERGGDWILYFFNHQEQQKFLHALKQAMGESQYLPTTCPDPRLIIRTEETLRRINHQQVLLATI